MARVPALGSGNPRLRLEEQGMTNTSLWKAPDQHSPDLSAQCILPQTAERLPGGSSSRIHSACAKLGVIFLASC